MFLTNSELDLPPEHCHYQDNGCEFSDSCLNCPFPDCIHAQPGGKQRWLMVLRDKEVLKLFTTQGKKNRGFSLDVRRQPAHHPANIEESQIRTQPKNQDCKGGRWIRILLSHS
jgi:hypothetical protein